jgi:hypothetical protein
MYSFYNPLSPLGPLGPLVYYDIFIILLQLYNAGKEDVKIYKDFRCIYV